jgi:putative transposase
VFVPFNTVLGLPFASCSRGRESGIAAPDGVLRRSAKKRLTLTVADRVFWAWLSGAWADWKSALVIVKPETVIAWHRKGFRLFWTWKLRHGKTGRPAVSQEVRDLIRTMSVKRQALGTALDSGRRLG